MKIAFCFGGQLRTAEYAANNILNFIGNLLPNIDFFIHTWDINNFRKRYGNSQKIFEICQEQGIDNPDKLDKSILRPFADLNTFDVLKKINSIYNFKSVEVECYANYKDINVKGGQFPPHFYSWYKSIKLKKSFEELRNFKYDIVVKTRPDIIVPRDTKLKDEIDLFLTDPAKFYAQGSHSNRVNDVFWLASSAVMDTASEFFLKSPVRTQTATFLFDYLQSENIPISCTKFNKFGIYRPESIPTDSINFEKCYNDDRDWYWTKNDVFRYNVS